MADRRHHPRHRRRFPPPEPPSVPPEIAEARREYTDALRAWIASRGEDEPPAKARLLAARAAVTEATNPKESP